MPRQLKPIIIIALFLGLVLSIFVWFYSHSYIEIRLGNGTADYALYDQSSNKAIEVKQAAGTIKKLVRRSQFELSAISNNGSYFVVVKTGGFLGTTTVDIKPQAENDRVFVGGNPEPCMSYLKTVLVSFVCGSAYDQAQVHTRATEREPSFGLRQPLTTEGSLINIVGLENGGSVALVEETLQGDEIGSTKSIYLLSDSLKPAKKRLLDTLGKAKSYGLAPHGKGFLLYSTDFEEVWTLGSFDAKPERISLSIPKDGGQKAYAIASRGDSFVVGYSNLGDDQDLDDPNISADSQFVVYRGKTGKIFGIDGNFSSVRLCGSNKLCLVKAGALEVYDISGDKAKRLFELSGVQFIENNGNTLLVINSQGVVALNVDQQNGYFSYTFGNYTYCGFSDDATGYVLCLINPGQEKVAIRVDRNKEDTSTIDKKILGLSGVDGVQKISVYENYVFIVPEQGELVFDEVDQIFTYDKRRLQTISAAVNTEAAKQGIDRSRFRIINIAQ